MKIHHIVEEAMAYWPVLQQTTISNQVNTSLRSGSCGKKVKTILERLLLYAAAYADNRFIQVESKTFRNIAIIKIRYRESRTEIAIEKQLEDIKTLAEQLGGCLYINNSKLRGASISVTFLCDELLFGN